ncbi:branched-chain amino acid ABC transporter permease [Tistlia consotensis]|uniref:branched-chain amino acid ABC transporter permease n=1 Tax=Tistlia consotensis TaxID=1321365 RepID=UPI000A154070|nr:branched-chain amino acid ABC transporter permease [Tistlia consotensis]
MRTPLLLALVLALLIGLPPFLDLGLQNALVNVLIAGLFALAFNLLVGQAGLLSFGHAAYFGIGAFATLHLMRAVEDGLAFPTPLLPLAGAAAGLAVGAVAGFFATLRSGVYFALVTLAIAELFHSLAPHWEGLFGGEAGLSSMRMPWGGLIFGSTLEVYYLALGWVTLSVWLLWAYTRTPFGRLTLALRDNEQRVRFLGYDAHATKVIVFAISAMFSGVAGALQAISNETANYSLFSAHVSAGVVLNTFVGGSTVFFGPALGAAAFTLFDHLVSDLTRSWQLYQGLIFVLVMLFAPGGIGGIVQHHLRHRRQLDWSRLAGPYALAGLGGALVAAGMVFMIESLSVLFGEGYAVLRRDAGGGHPPFEAFGAQWDPAGPLTWGLPLALFLAGLFLIARARRDIAALWESVRSAPAGRPAGRGPEASARSAPSGSPS